MRGARHHDVLAGALLSVSGEHPTPIPFAFLPNVVVVGVRGWSALGTLKLLCFALGVLLLLSQRGGEPRWC